MKVCQLLLAGIKYVLSEPLTHPVKHEANGEKLEKLLQSHAAVPKQMDSVDTPKTRIKDPWKNTSYVLNKIWNMSIKCKRLVDVIDLILLHSTFLKLQVGTREKFAHWFNTSPGTHVQTTGLYIFFTVTLTPIHNQLRNMTNPNCLQANLELVGRKNSSSYY